jgi:hypothetical protein
MAARVNASPVIYLPSVVDEKFLRTTAAILERLRAQSANRGHPLLASLLEIAKGEAEDDLRTRALRPEDTDTDDGVASMAQKFAFRAGTTGEHDSLS